MDDTPGSTREIRVWDLPLRLFHWALAVLVVAAIASAKFGDQISGAMDWHIRFGLCALTLLLFRLAWGFLGGTHARFASFVRGPRAVIDYLKRMSGETRPLLGHNPLGALSVLTLIGATLFQTLSGLFITDDITVEGPLYKHVSSHLASLLGKLHKGNSWLIIALVALHLAAILFYRLAKHDDLVTPMLTGKKNIPNGESPARDAEGGSVFLGLAVLAAAGALVWYVATQV